MVLGKAPVNVPDMYSWAMENSYKMSTSLTSTIVKCKRHEDVLKIYSENKNPCSEK